MVAIRIDQKTKTVKYTDEDGTRHTDQYESITDTVNAGIWQMQQALQRA